MQYRIIPCRGKPFRLTLMILFLLLSLLVSACQASPPQQANIRPAATQLGLTEENGTPVDVFLLLDQSDSINGWDQSQGMDPQGLRMEASRYFLNNLAQRSKTPPYLRVGIINFGTDAPIDAMQPLSELTSSDTTTLPRLTARLTTPMMGYTNFQAALQRAEEGFQQAKTFDLGRKGVVVLFTDGEPDDPRRLSLDGYFSEIKDFVQSRLLSRGCELFVIGIDSIGEAWSRSIPYWQQFLPEERILRLTSMEDLRQRFNEVIRQTFFLPNTVPDQILGKELQFDVQPYLEEIQFDIYPEGAGNPQLAIFDPQGTQVQEGPGIELKRYDSYTSITVETPAPGQWMYKIIEGQGRVVVYKTLLPIKMQLVSPSPVHPLGREMQVIALFRKADGSPVPEIAQYPLRYTGQVTAPDGSVSSFLFNAGEGGLFYADKGFQPRTTGVYQVSLTVSGRQGYETTSAYQVKVAEQPYLVLESPTSGSVLAGFRQGLPIMVSFFQGNQPVSPGQTLSTNPNSLVVAEVVAGPEGDGWQSQAIYLDYREDLGKLQGVLPVSLNTAGFFILKLEVRGRLSTGEELLDAVSVSFQVVPTFWDSINRWFIWGGLGILILLTLGYLALRRRSRPRLFGTIHYQGEMFDLDRRFRFTMGGSGCNLILSSDLPRGTLARLLPQWEESEPGEPREVHVLLESKSSAEEREFQPPRRLYDGERFHVLGTYEVEYRQS